MSDIALFIGALLSQIGKAALFAALLPILILIFPAYFAKPGEVVVTWLDKASGWAMRVAMIASFLIILFQLAAVLLRYVFGLSFSWMTDSIIFAFATIFMLGAAATLRDDGHVRVDILRPKFSPKGRAIIELVGSLAFIWPIGVLILYAGASSLARSWQFLEPFNESDGLPVKYLFKTLIPAFAVLIMAQGLSQALKAALGLCGRRPLDDEPKHAVGPA